MGRPTNKQILAAARRGLEAMASQVLSNESVAGMRELAEQYVVGGDSRVPPHLLRSRVFTSGMDIGLIMAGARDGAIFRLWARSKVVYAMDDRLLHYLAESSTSRIPTEVLRNLPHADPYIMLPPSDTDDDHHTSVGVPLGAFVFGRYDNATRLCSTADATREDLGLMFLGFVATDEGPILQTLRCTVPLGGSTFSVEDAVAATISRFVFNQDLGKERAVHLEEWLRTHVAQILNSLLYVCTDQPDISEYAPGSPAVRKSRKKKERRPRPSDVNTMVELGFRMGPALYEAQRHWDETQRPGPGAAGTGQVQRPHRKRAHYRTYWTGPGRTVPALRWIAPFWVHGDELLGSDGPRDVVVRPVRQRP